MVGKKVYLVGIGMGTTETLTMQAAQIIRESEILIGARRMLEHYREQEGEGQICYVAYEPKKIGRYLREQKAFRQAAVLLSGDVGFYSGAAGLLKELKDFTVELLPGISSLVYFCSCLQIPWQEVCYTSVHGQRVNLIQRIQRNAYVFALLSGQEDLHRLCEKLSFYSMQGVLVHVGERLSYPDEKIYHGTPQELEHLEISSLAVVLVENPNAQDYMYRQIDDDEFLRDKVPMTKGEVRTACITKLHLTKDAVVYDVGAGSGSVSIEIALQAPDIQVYAIEKNPKAVELILQNKQKFCADNVEVVQGMAPQALQDLPVPTHAFVGGSAGNMEQILTLIFQKNRKCRVVLTTVSLDSLAEVMEILKKQNRYDADIAQLQVAKRKMVGSYSMMMGQNPIYIITVTIR